ncbi:hypothetical protein QF034_003826 [Streptomyces africanus]|uniref:Uncharacterized protein n=1 Tax=Streptomyces africanus TaxID=231024 RepID=A0ABU0QR15_9ACTN|nr:hypothetical protein [Streptomyces africanus]
MHEESLAVPFATTVLGADVSVVGVDLAEEGRVVARCARGPVRQDIGILDLPLAPAPEGSQWIKAYRYWARCTGTSHNGPAEPLLERTVAPAAADRIYCGKQRARSAHTAVCLPLWLTPHASR